MRRFLVLVLIVATSAFLVPGSAHATNSNQNFFYSGLAYGQMSYPTKLQSAVTRNVNTGGANQIPLSIDLLGYYVPGPMVNVVWGGLLSEFIDYYSISGAWSQISQTSLAASALYFLDGQNTQGKYLRADLGLCEAFASGTETGSIWSIPGALVTLGAGYLMPFGSVTTSVQVTYSYRVIESQPYGLLTIGLGVFY